MMNERARIKERQEAFIHQSPKISPALWIPNTPCWSAHIDCNYGPQEKRTIGRIEVDIIADVID